MLGVPITYRVGNAISTSLTLNVSHGGVAIRTTNPLDVASVYACASACLARRRKSMPKPASRGATAASAWVFSSRQSIRPRRR